MCMTTETLSDVPCVACAGKEEKTARQPLHVVARRCERLQLKNAPNGPACLKLNFVMALMAQGGAFIAGRQGEIEWLSHRLPSTPWLKLEST